MSKILIVGSDETFRSFLYQRLGDTYDVSDTGDAQEALAHGARSPARLHIAGLAGRGTERPELCHRLNSLSVTRSIPIFVTAGETGEDFKALCSTLGVNEFVDKFLDCNQLKGRLAATLKLKQPERRCERRVHLRVDVKLCGLDPHGDKFELQTKTEDLSASGFRCGLPIVLSKDAAVDVFLVTGGDRFAGRAKAVRAEQQAAPLGFYGFQFTERPSAWIVQ
jgi:DNA-binding response OmpR family regulator